MLCYRNFKVLELNSLVLYYSEEQNKIFIVSGHFSERYDMFEKDVQRCFVKKRYIDEQYIICILYQQYFNLFQLKLHSCVMCTYLKCFDQIPFDLMSLFLLQTFMNRRKDTIRLNIKIQRILESKRLCRTFWFKNMKDSLSFRIVICV